MRVGYQGVNGAFSQMALRSYFKEGCEEIGYSSFKQMFEDLQDKKLDYALFPVENTTTGIISRTYDLFQDYQVYAVGEIVIPIRQDLIALKGTKIEQIREVYSHPEALSQCEGLFRKYPHMKGAKEGFTTAVRIIPYLVAILVAIGVFRASGAMDMLTEGIEWTVTACGFDAEFVKALPTALMKPLSGSGARGMMVDAMTTYGADSFAGRLSCIFQGSTDTTFYILAVYFGSVGIRYTRHAVTCGLLADLAGIIAAIFIAYFFFGG